MGMKRTTSSVPGSRLCERPAFVVLFLVTVGAFVSQLSLPYFEHIWPFWHLKDPIGDFRAPDRIEAERSRLHVRLSTTFSSPALLMVGAWRASRAQATLTPVETIDRTANAKDVWLWLLRRDHTCGSSGVFCDASVCAGSRERRDWRGKRILQPLSLL